jgi:diaminopimelate decarboxylase
MPATERGDLLVMRSAGAYGEAMAFGYNCRALPKAVLSTDVK